MQLFSTILKKKFFLLRNGLLELAEFVGKDKESPVLPRRFASSGLFLAFDRIFSHAFDYILYPTVIYYSCLVWELPSGFILGGFFMTVLSFLVCWLWVVLYDKFDVDLLILEDLIID